jgi:hypothetical protein
VGCGGRRCAFDERRGVRTAKSCGPDAPTLASSRVERSAWRWWQESPVTRESAKETVKLSCRESRIASAEPVCSCAHLLVHLHTRPRVQRAPGFPCALLIQGGQGSCKPRAIGAARTRTHIPTIVARACGPLQYSRDINDRNRQAAAYWKPRAGHNGFSRRTLACPGRGAACNAAELVIGRAFARPLAEPGSILSSSRMNDRPQLCSAPQRCAARPGRESDSNRLAGIRHRRRQAAIDRDRLAVDIGGVVAG